MSYFIFLVYFVMPYKEWITLLFFSQNNWIPNKEWTSLLFMLKIDFIMQKKKSSKPQELIFVNPSMSNPPVGPNFKSREPTRAHIISETISWRLAGRTWLFRSGLRLLSFPSFEIITQKPLHFIFYQFISKISLFCNQT